MTQVSNIVVVLMLLLDFGTQSTRSWSTSVSQAVLHTLLALPCLDSSYHILSLWLSLSLYVLVGVALFRIKKESHTHTYTQDMSLGLALHCIASFKISLLWFSISIYPKSDFELNRLHSIYLEVSQVVAFFFTQLGVFSFFGRFGVLFISILPTAFCNSKEVAFF